MTDNVKRSKAGEAFAAEMARDPQTKVAWERTQKRLCDFGEGAGAVRPPIEAVLSTVRRISKKAHKMAGKMARHDLAEALRALGKELEVNRKVWEAEYDQPYPKELGDWIRLAARAGVPFDSIESGRLSDLLNHIEGYLLRLRDEKSLTARGGNAGGSHGPKSKPTPDIDLGLPTCVLNAVALYDRACEILGNDDPTDKQAYLVLKRLYDGNGMNDEDRTLALPKTFDTFARYLRQWRKAADQRKLVRRSCMRNTKF